MTSESLLTVKEAALQLRLHPMTVYRLLASGELESAKIGSSRRIRPQALADFVQAKTAREASDAANKMIRDQIAAKREQSQREIERFFGSGETND